MAEPRQYEDLTEEEKRIFAKPIAQGATILKSYIGANVRYEIVKPQTTPMSKRLR